MSSKRITKKLSSVVDLSLVHPSDYNLADMTIQASYSLVAGRLQQNRGAHSPRGELFIIYGDETSKNLGLEFAQRQYRFLKRLKGRRNFNNFFNDPESEERTLKSYLVGLCSDPELKIAQTYIFESYDQIKRLLDKPEPIILKPIFGCRGAGVKLVSSLEDAVGLGPENNLKGNYVLQEVLEGDEKRVVLLDGKLLCSRVHKNRKTPWNPNMPQQTFVYNPSAEELEVSRKIAESLGLTLAGIDFIGSKVNEINGTGTGIVIPDHNGSLLYDHTDAFVAKVMEYVK